MWSEDETSDRKIEQQNQNNLTTDNKQKIDDKSTDKIEKQKSSSSGCIVDSGFMSGPQLSGYDTSEGEEEEVKKVKEEDKKLNIATSTATTTKTATTTPFDSSSSSSCIITQEHSDSGCGTSSSGCKVSEEDNIGTDSGLILDTSDTDRQMILDSGVDVNTTSGLNEWFCNLSLKDQQQQRLNDLSSKKKSLTATNNKNVHIENTEKNNSNKSQHQQQQHQKQPWQIYYQQNSDGDTQLHIACATGYIDVVSALILLAPHPCLLDIQNDDALTALHIAVLTGQKNIVRILIIGGASPIIRDRNGNTALHLACNYGDLDCVKALTSPLTLTEIQQRRNLTEKQKMHLYSLSTSSSSITSTLSSPSSIKITSIKLPQDLELRNYDGERCIHLATKSNHINIIKYLISIGSDINAREGKSGLTPLHLAIEMCNEKLANFILEEYQNNINLETETYSGLTAYQLAVMVQLSQMQKILQKYGAEPLTPPDSDQDDDDESDSDDIEFDNLQQQQHNHFYNSSRNGGNAINVS